MGNKILNVKNLVPDHYRKIISSGAGAWGGSLRKKQKDKIASLQRFFLLQVLRGYKTISNNTLHIITGINSITLIIDYEFHKSNIL